MYTNSKIELKWKGLLLGLSLFLSGNGIAQSYFNEAYPQGTRCFQAIEKDGLYYGVAHMIDTSNFSFFVRLFNTDQNGVFLTNTDFSDSVYNVYPSNISSLEETPDSGFITVITKTSLPFENGLLKFEDDLSIEWYRVPKVDSLQRDFFQVKPTPDGGYIIVGYLFRNNMYETMLMKVDSAANPEWERFYQGANGQSLQPFFVFNAPDGGYLVTGLEKDLADATTNDPFLLRVDSVGNVIWKRVLGSPGFDGLPATTYYNNGKRLIAVYSQETDSIPDPQTGYRSFTQVVVKLDAQNGFVLDQDTIDVVFPRMYTYNITFSNNLAVAVGEFLNFDTLKLGGAFLGFTLAVDTSLNEHWFKTYSHRKATAQFDDWNSLYDIRPTSDGGFICAGTHQKDDALGTGRAGFHAWLLKLDSTGCEVPLCANQIGEEEIPLAKMGEMSVYPNPASREFNVSVGGLSHGTVQLVDMRGVVLQQKTLENGAVVLPIDNITGGFYLIRVIDAKGFSLVKKVSVVSY